MARYKTFDSTGIAPNGRLYAGDLNAIQDFLAKASDFTQTIDTGTLRVGDSSIQLLKFGTAEARISAALRTDGILRGLGGIGYPSFTTTTRDAIALGSRPTGLAIFNTTTNRIEVNIGTDAAPIWVGSSDPIPGVMQPWPWSEGSTPGGWVACYGQSITKLANPILWARASADSFPYGGDASNLTLPDLRGRAPIGKDNMGGSAAGRMGVGHGGQTLGGMPSTEEFHTLADSEGPYHNHTVNSHSHSGVTTSAGAHDHGSGYAPGVQFYNDSGSFSGLVWGSAGTAVRMSAWASAPNHQHGVFSEAPATDFRGGSAGVTQPHNNVQPGFILNWIIKLG